MNTQINMTLQQMFNAANNINKSLDDLVEEKVISLQDYKRLSKKANDLCADLASTIAELSVEQKSL